MTSSIMRCVRLSGFALSRGRACTRRACSSPPLCRRKTVAVGMSGGVDSSLTAALLQEQGFEVHGVHIRSWDESDEAGVRVCPATEDAKAAQLACDHLRVPLTHVDFSQEYWTRVFEPFVAAYRAGKTPNPDMDCNRHIKFGAFRHYALDTLGVDFIATGHYATVKFVDEHSGCRLYRGVDPIKDQSYFLSRVLPADFNKVLMPLGVMTKQAVRQAARQRNLPSASRRDSYGICFVGKRKFADFLSNYLPTTPGFFRDVDTDAVVGTHSGCELFTTGQSARISGAACKWFVVSKHPGTGSVWVARGTDHPALLATALRMPLIDFNWLSPSHQATVVGFEPLRCAFKLRHNQPAVSLGSLTVVTADNGTLDLHLSFDEPYKSVSPGQIAAVYCPRTQKCVGAGVIGSVQRAGSPSFQSLEAPVPVPVPHP